MEIKYKQYVFLPKSLNMSVGKASSQVAHATFLALENQREIIKRYHPTGNDCGCTDDGYWDNIDYWKDNGMCVIVLECEDTEHLNNIAKYLDQWKIPNHLYIDEGMTEVLPMTPTALATGIVSEDKFWMFEQFKLFGSKDSAQEIVDGNIPKQALLTNAQTKKLKNMDGCYYCRGRNIPVCFKCGSYSVRINVSD